MKVLRISHLVAQGRNAMKTFFTQGVEEAGLGSVFYLANAAFCVKIQKHRSFLFRIQTTQIGQWLRKDNQLTLIKEIGYR